MHDPRDRTAPDLPGAASAAPRGPKLDLLYIEDHAASVSVMRAVLELRPTWRMSHAATVRAGIELVRSSRPHLVVLDMRLPDGSGAEVLEAARADPETAKIPFAVLTAGKIEPEVEHQLIKLDVTLSKPIDLSAFLDVLDEHEARW